MTDSQAPARADRHAEIAAGLARVHSRIADACAAAGRDRADVTMIAVTKTYPASDVVTLVGLGVTDVGENRDQEAATKAAQVAAAGPGTRARFWREMAGASLLGLAITGALAALGGDEVSTEEMEAAFAPLIEWKNRMGSPAVIRTVSWMSAPLRKLALMNSRVATTVLIPRAVL